MMRRVSLAIVILGLSSAAVYLMFQLFAPDVYMDEIFHVAQTQKYCSGEWWDWDAKITTFPGLYLLGYVLSSFFRLLSAVFHFEADYCGTAALRAVNLLFATGCLPLLYHLCKLAHPGTNSAKVLLRALACAIFPLHYFYAFLYYTDVPSVFFILATYLATKQHQTVLSGIAAAAAIAVRQTNAVWVSFSAAEAILDQCQKDIDRISIHAKAEVAQPHHSSANQALLGSGLRELRNLIVRAWASKERLARQLCGHVLLVLAFVAFVVWNGGVAVGDRENHTPVKHLMQPLYFSLFSAVSLAPILCWPTFVLNLLKGTRKLKSWQWATSFAAWGIAVHLVQNYTLVHPFLLADNRHYTFYLWRKVFNRAWWVRYAFAPLYLLSSVLITSLLQHKGWLWLACFWVCTCLVLIPAHLIELRYFTVPFLVVLLNIRTRSVQLKYLLFGFVVMDCIIIAVYLWKPYIWVDGTVARFLW